MSATLDQIKREAHTFNWASVAKFPAVKMATGRGGDCTAKNRKRHVFNGGTVCRNCGAQRSKR